MNAPTTEQRNLDDPRPMAEILAHLKRIRAHKAKAQTEIDTIAAFEADFRDELEARMQADGIRTGEGYGLQAQLKTRKSNVVTDVATLTASLHEAGVLDDHLVLSKASAAKVAVTNGWEGAEVQETTYLAISEVKS